jgi:signal transduction histidine kinase/ligand-binding sensor domain-containing protein/DNA-binding response OmpR family regulator
VKFPIFISFFALLIFTESRSQSGKLFSVDKELSSSLINHIYQDHRGVIWIATVDGLNRYDGSKFTHYKKISGDSTSLLNNYVRLLFEDSKNRLFAGFFNGLQHYDYATDKFHDIPLVLNNGNVFSAHVTSVLERHNGDLLIGTSGHGVFLLRADSDIMRANQAIEFCPSYLVSQLYEDSDQHIWIATQDKGLFRIGNDHQFKHYLSAAESGTILSLCEDKKGNLYAGSVNRGLYAYHSQSDSFHLIPSDAGSPFSINTLCLSQSGDILVGTEGEGLKIFDPKAKKFSEGNFSINTLDFSKSKVHSIMEDKRGNIWLGIYQKGIVLLPSKSNNFKYVGYKSIKNNIIGSNAVTSVHRDDDGTLWIGTDGDGIYGLRSHGQQPVHFTRAENATVPSTILSIHEDRFGKLWLGSYDRGLGVLNTKTGDCNYVNHLLRKHNGQVPRIFSIAEDDQNNLWVATMGSGLYCINLLSHKVEHYLAPYGANYRDDANTLHSDWIYSIHISNHGKLFIGTVDGMGCLDLKTRSFNSTFGVNRLLAGTIVNVLYADERGTLWIGTSEGLTSCNVNLHELRTYTIDDGLPSNVICAIQQDTLDNLWISTNYGISRMNLKSKNFINYYSGDGLQGNEFSRAAAHVDKNGLITFGGINGITAFSPAEITNENKILEVHVTGLYIHNKPVTKGMKSETYSIVNASVMEADTFHISQKDNSFTIEFSCMEFNNPERITYMYTLQEDGDWIMLPPGTNNVTFNNLNPGSYTFKVRAKDYNTYSSAKVISVIVHPVWYFSTVAKVVYMIALISIVYVFIQQARQRQRTKQKMREHMQAKQMNDAKLQFFINIAHEIRTPMSLIISPLKRLVLKDKDKERQRAYFTMNQNSERIVRLINQLMDVQRIDMGQMKLKFHEKEMVSFIREVCLAFKEEVHSRKINLRFTHELKLLPAYIDPNNFDKVILNILSNALKFTPANGDVSVHLSMTKGKHGPKKGGREYFQITVSDTGIGIPEGEIEKVFECFYQTRESKHVFRQGTGIGLHLTKSIVELHQGFIWAENNIAAPGCRFIVQLPVGKDHLKPEDIFLDDDSPGEHEPMHQSDVLPVPLPEVKVKSKNKHRVLVVDDDQGLREYLCNEMGAEYHMAKCANGKEALTSILEHNPDLVISDIVMPEMDGITLCRKVKQNVNINHIPVVLLTAKKEEQYNLEALGIGADAYIVKPFNIEIVLKTVQNIIRNRDILRNNYLGKQQQKEKIRDIAVKSPDEKLLGKVMATINENITNSELSVKMLADEIGISRVHLHRKLKELTNQSTRDLIRNIRLQQAAKLLAEKHLNISEVAFAVGFTNAAHFSSAFKELYGVSPTVYMETQRGG